MKSLQISKFYPPTLGGIESVAFELTEGLNRLGITTDVLCANNQNHTIREKALLGYNITRTASVGSLLSTSISPAQLFETKRICNNYDVIHIQMPNPMAALAVWYARPKGKIILHWQSDVVKQKIALKLYKPLQNWVLKRADHIIASTPPYAKSSECLSAWKDKVVVIPNGISPIKTTNSSITAREIIEQYDGRKIIFSLGRMTYYKGFDVLIQAAHLITNDAIILVGGDGDLLQQHRERVIAENLTSKIKFLGRIPENHLAAYFNAASVFCLSSTARSEAYGVVMLEAMAMGKPIVATNIPGSGVNWVNQHNITGLNATCNDSLSLSLALNTLLSNEMLASKMGKAGLLRFEQEFKASVMVTRVANLYNKVLKN